MSNILLPLVGALLAAPLAAQNVRLPQQIDLGLTGPSVGPAMASDGDLSVAVWKDDVVDQMFASVSDGSGRTWTAPVRMDDAATGNKFAEVHALAIAGGVIHSSWRDERNSLADDVYYTRSTDGGLTWEANQLLDKGYPIGGNDVRTWRMSADASLVAALISPEQPNLDEDLYFTYSTMSGAAGTWTATAAATTHNGLGDVDEIDLAVFGPCIAMAWQDNSTNGVDDQVYLSIYDVNLLAFVVQDLLISANSAAAGGDSEDNVAVSGSASGIAIAFQVDYPTANEELRVALTDLAGTITLADVKVGNYTTAADVDNIEVLARADGSTVVAWEDNRTVSAMDEIWTARSTGGAFTEGVSLGTGGFPRLTGATGDYVGTTFSSGSFPENAGLSLSRDGGATFNPLVDASTGLTGDTDFTEFAYNALYGNFVCGWLSDDLGINHLYVGGARSASLAANGPFTVGLPVNFSVSGFGAGESGDSFQVVVSTGNGTPFALLPFGDGRSICLTDTPTVIASATSSLLAGTLSASGDGVTPIISFPNIFPVGTTLHAIAVSRAGTLFGSITDTVPFTVE